MYRVLFVCVGNAGRSQMAEAYFNHMAKGRAFATSAGTVPADRISPDVINLMREEGIDISGAHPKLLTKDMLENVDRVITMGCGVENICPARWISTEDWGLPDPKGRSIAEIRDIRDEIKEKVVRLLTEIEGR